MFLFHIHAALRVSELLAEQFLGYGILFGGLLLMFRLQYERPFWRSLGGPERPSRFSGMSSAAWAPPS